MFSLKCQKPENNSGGLFIDNINASLIFQEA